MAKTRQKIINTFIIPTVVIANLKHVVVTVDSTDFTLYGSPYYFLR